MHSHVLLKCIKSKGANVSNKNWVTDHTVKRNVNRRVYSKISTKLLSATTSAEPEPHSEDTELTQNWASCIASSEGCHHIVLEKSTVNCPKHSSNKPEEL